MHDCCVPSIDNGVFLDASSYVFIYEVGVAGELWDLELEGGVNSCGVITEDPPEAQILQVTNFHAI
jgi:hypothetical protein